MFDICEEVERLTLEHVYRFPLIMFEIPIIITAVVSESSEVLYLLRVAR